MRKLNMPDLNSVQDPVVRRLFTQIVRASQEADVVDLGQAFTISGTYTATRTLNVTSPSLANIAAVLATFLSDLQHGGSTKTN